MWLEGQLPRDTVHVSVMEEIYIQSLTMECRSGLRRTVSLERLVAGVFSGDRALTGKLVAACRYWTHCLTQVWMRLYSERVPQTGRRWRLIDSLVEDSVLEAEEVIVVDLDPLSLSLEIETESEEDLDFMNESESWLETETESSQVESEEELDWEGLIET